MSNAVAAPSKLSSRNSASLKKIRDLRGGVAQMRVMGRTYLPQETKESDADYDNRLKRSWLFPGLDKAIEDVADRVFAREVRFGEDVPPVIAELEADITADGRNLNNFARDLFEDGVEAGLSFILVDMPRKDGEMTIAQERQANMRPYVTMVRAEQVLGWKTERIGGKTVLSQVRIMETATEDGEDEFEQIEVPQVRVLQRSEGKVWGRLYREDDKGDWLMHEDFTVDMDEISIVPFYTRRTGFFQGRPNFEGLADLNVAHWQSASDQRNILHYARVPLLVALGMSADDFTVAVNSSISTSRPKTEADVKWVEHEGKAIGAGRDDLKDLEQSMRVLGLELMLPKTGNPTATGEAIDAAKSQTPLAQMANNLKESLERMAYFMGLYINLAGEFTVNVNTDYGLSLLNQADLTLLLQAVNTGQLSRQTFLKELIRRNVLMDDLDIDDEIERIKDEEPEPISLPLNLEDDDEDEDDEDDEQDEAA